MNPSKIKRLSLNFLFIFGTMFSAVNLEATNLKPKLTEPQKIQLLIAYVKSLKNATFIRNGSEHTPKEAAEHMQLKLKKAGREVKTAVHFIALCASKSSLSGKDYLIKFPNGKTVKSFDFLMEELKRIEKVNN